MSSVIKKSAFKFTSCILLPAVAIIITVYILTLRTDIALIAGGADITIKIILYVFYKKGLQKKSGSFVLWFTGLSGSGKSTIADKIYDYLDGKGYKVERLDGDSVRTIFPQTGFTREERNTHIKKIGYLASILEKNRIIVLASFVSPYNESRNFVRGLCKNYIEIYVNAPLEKCEERDVKGLYAKARRGEIKNFTGISDPFEVPGNPEITLYTASETIEESCGKIKKYIRRYL